MVEIINLRQARKAKKRADAALQAAENRVRFGRDKGAKKLDAHEKNAAERAHEGRALTDTEADKAD
jgi:hypothetical protein